LHVTKLAQGKPDGCKIQLQSAFLVGCLLCILGIAGYFALRKAHESRVIAVVKQSEGTVESPATGKFSELASSRDGRLMVVVRDNQRVGVLDPRLETTVRIFESNPNEWTYGPILSPDGSLLATPSNTPNLQSVGHLRLLNPSTGQRLASVDNLCCPVCCASFNPARTLIAVAGNITLYLVDPPAPSGKTD